MYSSDLSRYAGVISMYSDDPCRYTGSISRYGGYLSRNTGDPSRYTGDEKVYTCNIEEAERAQSSLELQKALACVSSSLHSRCFMDS